MLKFELLGDDTWQVSIGIANTGWLSTTVTERARRDDLVRPILAELDGVDDVLDGASRRTLGQLVKLGVGHPVYRQHGGHPGLRQLLVARSSCRRQRDPGDRAASASGQRLGRHRARTLIARTA